MGMLPTKIQNVLRAINSTTTQAYYEIVERIYIYITLCNYLTLNGKKKTESQCFTVIITGYNGVLTLHVRKFHSASASETITII